MSNKYFRFISDSEVSQKKDKQVFPVVLLQFDRISTRVRVQSKVPDGVVVFLLQLLQAGGVEVKLSASRKADGILGLDDQRTLATSGWEAERRQVCRATGTGEQTQEIKCK